MSNLAARGIAPRVYRSLLSLDGVETVFRESLWRWTTNAEPPAWTQINNLINLFVTHSSLNFIIKNLLWPIPTQTLLHKVQHVADWVEPLSRSLHSPPPPLKFLHTSPSPPLFFLLYVHESHGQSSSNNIYNWEYFKMLAYALWVEVEWRMSNPATAKAGAASPS